MRKLRTPSLLVASSIFAILAACGEVAAPKPPSAIAPSASARPTDSGAPAAAAPSAPVPSAPASSVPPTASTAAAVIDSKVDPSGWKVSTSADDPQWLEVAGFRAPKPASWAWTKPSMQFRTLQYTVPGEGDSTKAAELIVSVFVAGDGGPLDANIERWRGQFRKNNEPVEAKRSSKEVGPLKVEFVELEGDFMAMGAPAPKKESLQLAAIVQAEGRNVFFRLVGPKETVEANRESFNKLIDGLMPAD
jgi:hypothetical protein